MTLQVFKMKDGVEKNWDDVNLETEIEVVAQFEGETNEECEAAAAVDFSDTDVYGWTYNETI